MSDSNKTCCRCKASKPRTEFGPDKVRPDGLQPRCVPCNRAYFAAYRAKNKTKIAGIMKRWGQRHRAKKREYNKSYRRRNPDMSQAACRKWRANHPEKARALSRARARRLRHATPPWADLKAIKAFYEACPTGYHVDHIVPLNGKIVSGLHVLENLQYLTAEENRLKSNKWEEVA